MSTQVEQASIIDTEENQPAIPRHIEECGVLSGVFEGPLINLRVFYTNTGFAFQGVLLSETEDSFLVGGGIRMVVTTAGDFAVQPVGSEHVQRWMKSAIQYICLPVDQVKYHYYKKMVEEGDDYIGDFFDAERIQVMKDFMVEYENSGKPIIPEGLEDIRRRINAGTVGDFTPSSSGLREVLDAAREVGAGEHSFVTLQESKEIH